MRLIRGPHKGVRVSHRVGRANFVRHRGTEEFESDQASAAGG